MVSEDDLIKNENNDFWYKITVKNPKEYTSMSLKKIALKIHDNSLEDP